MLQGILIASIVIPGTLVAQEGRLKYANKLFESKSYYYAAEAYEDVIARNTDSSVVANRLAESYDKTGNIEKAIEWYQVTERTDRLTEQQQLRLGLLQRQVGNYDSSEQILARYEAQYGENDVAREILS